MSDKDSNSKILSIVHAAKSFGDVKVLSDITMSVARGDVVAIIGPSGSGKSTLLRCATLLETLDGGTLKYGDMVVAANGVYSPKSVLQAVKTRFGLVFQNFNLFPHLHRSGIFHLDVSILERIIANSRNTIRYYDTYKAAASVKCQFTDARDTATYGNVSKTTAKCKSTIIYGCDTIRNNNAHKTHTTIKTILLNDFDCIGNSDAFKR